MTLGAAERKALEAGSEYFPYFSWKARSTTARRASALEPDGITSAPLRDYVDRLLDFATRARWGKRPISRVDAFAAERTRFRSEPRRSAAASDPEPEDGAPHPGGRRAAGLPAPRPTR